MQTKGYARTLIDNRLRPMDEETVEERIAARMERQAIRTGSEPEAQAPGRPAETSEAHRPPRSVPAPRSTPPRTR
ncbi:Scr1 family TA system antitoxin-like transcriptional regulator [Streptomyces sp. NPDC002838]|uniref:Scr1 family TA system antitoxin-like transcriptional regulator n=1 Tax=Streptomyces sp. NPDC002838 TaxID=3154436 RepID=UPI00332CCF21